MMERAIGDMDDERSLGIEWFMIQTICLHMLDPLSHP